MKLAVHVVGVAEGGRGVSVAIAVTVGVAVLEGTGVADGPPGVWVGAVVRVAVGGSGVEVRVLLAALVAEACEVEVLVLVGGTTVGEAHPKTVMVPVMNGCGVQWYE
jgi:hypothetical protein